MLLSFPSAGFPAVPGFTIEAPAGWSAGPPAGGLLSAVAPAVPGRFRANVLVSAHRHAAPLTQETLVAGVRSRLAELPEVEIALDKMTEVGGRPAHVLQVSYRHPQAGTVVQAVLSVPVAQADVVDLFEVIGSAGANHVDDDYAQVDQALHTFRVQVGDAHRAT